MSESLAEYVRAQVRAEMARREITNTQLAHRLNVNSVWVSRRLRGQVSLSVEDIEKIAAAVGVPVAVLLERAA